MPSVAPPLPGIAAANREALARLVAADPVLVDCVPAGEALRLGSAWLVTRTGPSPVGGAVAGASTGSSDLRGSGRLVEEHEAALRHPVDGPRHSAVFPLAVRVGLEAGQVECALHEGERVGPSLAPVDHQDVDVTRDRVAAPGVGPEEHDASDG